MSSTTDHLAAWHAVVRSGDLRALQELIAEEAVFHSPVVHTPQRGRKLVLRYLAAAFGLFANPTFRYVREVTQGSTTVVEFEVEIEGVFVNGVDLITWNDDGKIVDFKVLIRPLQAVHLVHTRMARILAPSSGQPPSGSRPGRE